MPYYWPSGAPPPMAKILLKKKISGHLAGMGAPCCDNGHTSSKGMPRHAHGRWALMQLCGVDVTDVSLSWWCVRWLVRTESLE